MRLSVDACLHADCFTLSHKPVPAVCSAPSQTGFLDDPAQNIEDPAPNSRRLGFRKGAATIFCRAAQHASAEAWPELVRNKPAGGEYRYSQFARPGWHTAVERGAHAQTRQCSLLDQLCKIPTGVGPVVKE